MRVRIIYDKLRPGTWDEYEAAHKEVKKKAGHVPGLCTRWLTRDVDNRDASHSISLLVDEASMCAYERSEIIKNTIVPKLTPFSSGNCTTTHCGMRFRERFE